MISLIEIVLVAYWSSVLHGSVKKEEFYNIIMQIEIVLCLILEIKWHC